MPATAVGFSPRPGLCRQPPGSPWRPGHCKCRAWTIHAPSTCGWETRSGPSSVPPPSTAPGAYRISASRPGCIAARGHGVQSRSLCRNTAHPSGESGRTSATRTAPANSNRTLRPRIAPVHCRIRGHWPRPWNPVSVRSARQWQGVVSLTHSLGRLCESRMIGR
ncbi:hypothetical protein D3C76_963610 [compost metagenome]